jgi:ABC-type phosphate/phosphonate transport system substrate-binding protein
MAKLILSLAICLCLAPGASAQTVKIGVFPSNDPAKLQECMDILAGYLSGATGDTVEVLVTRDYGELTARLAEQSVDLAWINTLNYVRAKHDLPGIRYLTTYMERNEVTGVTQPFYQSYIVTTSNSGLKSLDQAGGMRFALQTRGPRRATRIRSCCFATEA